jgi:ABC-type transporter Mla MlaB component
VRAPVLRIERTAPGRLRVTGEVDRSNAAVLAEAIAIAAAGVPDGSPVEVDCSGVAFLDASGSQVLALAGREAAPSHPLVVLEPGRVIGHLLRRLARHTPTLTVLSDETALPRAS